MFYIWKLHVFSDSFTLFTKTTQLEMLCCCVELWGSFTLHCSSSLSCM